MKPEIHPDQIKQLLNRSLSQIKQPTLDRLRDIRKQALAHYEAHAAAPALATAGHNLTFDVPRKSYYWVLTILLAACLVSGVTYWHHGAKRNVSEVDFAILTDDLPIHMYVE